ncbi:YdeI/OmpD-associated family protein [Larkinella humicola]|uniref:Bacteriocin-protection protein n=1 Tax=Larkinella humicola TaxID=2607654 RepID=A0A5N1JD41_9BACT|nr:YdeI/OmpD-associated family protein [Larkinella humicola]KAA9353023.1 bacteriocin-protection protein [Larkinella humicola]
MPTFFATPAEFRQWLEQHHETEKELFVGFYKVGSGKPSITWPQSVDEALCFGWIDGIRKSIDETSYMIRFTPRKTKSIWSAVNLKRIGELIEQGLVKPTGLAVYRERDLKKAGLYSHEKEDQPLAAAFETQLKANEKAWQFFHQQAPSYQKTVRHWIMGAKQPETRLKRLMSLIEDSENGRKVAPFRRNGE